MKAKRIHWTICMGMSAVGALATTTTPWLDYIFNLINSLPGTPYVIHKGGEMRKDELIAYRWHSDATYPAGTTFIKRVASVAGDTVKRAGSAFWANDQYIGTARPFLEAGVFFQSTQEGTTGTGEYFASAPNPNSPDSWYVLTGNVRQAEAIERAYKIL